MSDVIFDGGHVDHDTEWVFYGKNGTETFSFRGDENTAKTVLIARYSINAEKPVIYYTNNRWETRYYYDCDIFIDDWNRGVAANLIDAIWGKSK